jgi:hypothetical protein
MASALEAAPAPSHLPEMALMTKSARVETSWWLALPTKPRLRRSDSTSSPSMTTTDAATATNLQAQQLQTAGAFPRVEINKSGVIPERSAKDFLEAAPRNDPLCPAVEALDGCSAGS